jgi:hypothetical protein
LKTEELKDEIAAIEAETELMKAKAELEALKEKMAEDE